LLCLRQCCRSDRVRGYLVVSRRGDLLAHVVGLHDWILNGHGSGTIRERLSSYTKPMGACKLMSDAPFPAASGPRRIKAPHLRSSPVDITGRRDLVRADMARDRSTHEFHVRANPIVMPRQVLQDDPTRPPQR